MVIMFHAWEPQLGVKVHQAPWNTTAFFAVYNVCNYKIKQNSRIQPNQWCLNIYASGTVNTHT